MEVIIHTVDAKKSFMLKKMCVTWFIWLRHEYDGRKISGSFTTQFWFPLAPFPHSMFISNIL